MRVAVFGLGNVLIGDDAVGPSVIAWLQSEYEFPSGVVVEDLGTPSLDLVGWMAGFDVVLFVDAVSAKGEPGALRTYDRQQIVKNPPSLRMSPHDPSLKETVLTLELMADAPGTVKLIGVIPKALDEFGLSGEVRAAIPSAGAAVLEELERLGIEAVRRDVPVPIRPFWDVA